ncbi:hypothetical protein SOVF_092420, partial [Spinacia oleracea]
HDERQLVENNDNNALEDQEGGNDLDETRNYGLENQENNIISNTLRNHDEETLADKEGGEDNSANKKKKKTYKTVTPRGPTRNLQMARMRPGEKKKVDFNIKGQPIGVNRACLASYCGSLVRDPLNAPLQKLKVFSEIPEENKEKMWDLVLEKFDIGLEDDQDEGEREKIKKERKTYIMGSLNKKYRNYRARLKADYYDIESTDEERLKEENRPPNVDKDDWEWLVEYFGSDEFKGKSTRNTKNRSYQDAGHTSGTKSFAQKVEDMFERDKVMPTMLKLYEETHSKNDKTPVTEVAKETMSKMKELLAQREAGEIKMTDEEIYAKVKPIGKRGRDRGKGVSPSITSLYGSFSEGEKLRKEANEAKIEAKEANEKNEALTKEMKVMKKNMELMKGFMGKIFDRLGFDMDELYAEWDGDGDGEGDEDEDEDVDEEHAVTAVAVAVAVTVVAVAVSCSCCNCSAVLLLYAAVLLLFFRFVRLDLTFQ